MNRKAETTARNEVAAEPQSMNGNGIESDLRSLERNRVELSEARAKWKEPT